MTDSYIDTPEYPVVAWQPDIAGTVTFIYDPSGSPISSVIDLSTNIGSDYWGFASSGSVQPELCAASSIQGRLCALLEDFFINDCSIANAGVSGSYSWSLPGWPKWIMHGSGSIVQNTTIAFDSVSTAAQFGFEDASSTFDYIGLLKTSDWNSAGYWAPNNLTVYDDRFSINADVYTSVSTYGNSYKTVAWGANKTVRLLTVPFVRPPYMYDYRASDAAFANPAGTDVDDPNNLYQTLYEVARRTNSVNASTPFRIYTSDGLYRLGYMVDPETIIDSSLNQVDAANRGTYWEVKIPFRDEPGNGGN